MAREETEIQKSILDLLLGLGVLVWRNHNQGVRIAGKGRIKSPSSGIPDIVGVCANGRFLGIEVKTKTGKVEAHQIAFHDRISLSGGLCFVARSVDDLDQFLPEILNRLPLPSATPFEPLQSSS